ncbi:MAG: hypothetical protein KAW17_11450 [Candidatus Eisenbacteria sp.]|nr:hypothetical protein [Candidatus Eisenbacteria bacterium]
MKRSAWLAPVILLSLLGAAYGGPPLDGIYTSAGGDLLMGRYSESWAGGGAGQVGNTVHAQSWNGSVLGTQWGVSCTAVVSPPVLVEDLVSEFGNGHRTYRTEYQGGEFWLSGTGAWGNGDVEYGGDLLYYTQTTTIQFVAEEPVSQVTNVQLTGYFDGYGKCMQLTIANAAGEGSGEKEDGYPVFLVSGAECVPDPSVGGEWGTVHSITLIVLYCSTPAEDWTWGTIKNLYR